jgi:hypothetical protein
VIPATTPTAANAAALVMIPPIAPTASITPLATIIMPTMSKMAAPAVSVRSILYGTSETTPTIEQLRLCSPFLDIIIFLEFLTMQDTVNMSFKLIGRVEAPISQ